MNVLIDYHHPQLLKSLKMLFENRLGMTVYTPSGYDWFEYGYFNYYDNQDQSRKFLDNPGISLKEAKKIKFDYILSTIPEKEECFLKFIADFQPQAKHIVVLGNVNYFPEYPNVMSSTSFDGVPGQNIVKFHQEFYTDLFERTFLPPRKLITSFLHNEASYKDFPFFKELQSFMPDYEFKSYGFNTTDGMLNEVQVAQAMNESMFIWHVKDTGEGYGHTVHTSAYMGKPMIYRSSYMKGSIAQKYLKHMDTGIDLDRTESIETTARQIRLLSHPAETLRMGDLIKSIFDENVNFEKEAQDVSIFLSRCI